MPEKMPKSFEKSLVMAAIHLKIAAPHNALP